MPKVINIINKHNTPEPELRNKVSFECRSCINCIYCIQHTRADLISYLACNRLKKILDKDYSDTCNSHIYKQDKNLEYGRPEVVEDIFDERELYLISSFIEEGYRQGYELLNISDTKRYVKRGNDTSLENGKMVILKLSDAFKQSYKKQII